MISGPQAVVGFIRVVWTANYSKTSTKTSKTKIRLEALVSMLYESDPGDYSKIKPSKSFPFHISQKSESNLRYVPAT